MYSETGRNHQYEKGLSKDDSYYYGDLLWERDVMAERRRPSNRPRDINVTAQIEDYIRSYL